MHPSRRTLTGVSVAMAVLGWGLMTVGAFVRATESGLGCPDWPSCHGKLLVGGHHAVIEEFHRWIATVLIIGLLGVAFFVFRDLRSDRRVFRQMFWVLALLALQVVLGGITVLLKNVSWTVVMHYGGAAALVLSISLLAVRLAYPRAQAAPLDGFRRLLTWFTCLTYALLLVGSTVANTDAGDACGKSYPLCKNTLTPGLDHKVVLDLIHRGGALIIFVLAIVVHVRSRRVRAEQRQIVLASQIVVTLILLPIALGAVFVTVGDHVSTAVLHSSAASATWLAIAFTFALGQTLGPSDAQLPPDPDSEPSLEPVAT